MKRTFTKQLLGRTAMLLLTLSASLTAMGGAKIGSSDVEWELTDGKLTISGTGAMPDFSKLVLSTTIPWYGNRTEITSIVIENYVTSIGDYAFYDCIAATSVSFGSGVGSIGISSFGHCTSLTDVEIPATVTSIGTNAFDGCTGITSLTFNQGLLSIGGYAFRGTAIEKITIPQSVTSIGSNPFSGCTSLTEITVTDGNSNYESPNNKCIVRKSNHHLITGLNSTVIPNDVTEISTSAFEGLTMSSISIPESVTNIRSLAFCDCKNITSITFPHGLKKIELRAFDGCTGLCSVFFVNATAIGEIAQWAFRNTQLVSVVIPCNPFFGDAAFPSTTSVTLNLSAHTANDGTKWMTFRNNMLSFQADENTTVYKAEIIENPNLQVKLTAISDRIVKKDNAVVLKSTGDHVVMTKVADTAGTGDFVGNKLLSTNDDGPRPDNCYTLADGSQGVGFYKYKQGSIIGKNKAYLIYSGSSSPSSRSFLGITTDDETTAIDAATKQEANDEWYTLDGRRMKGQPTKAGVYVKKNKVVVIK